MALTDPSEDTMVRGALGEIPVEPKSFFVILGPSHPGKLPVSNHNERLLPNRVLGKLINNPRQSYAVPVATNKMV